MPSKKFSDLATNPSPLLTDGLVTTRGAGVPDFLVPISAIPGGTNAWNNIPIFDVRDFGVKADNNTDDTAALNAMFLQFVGQTAIFLLPGICVVTAPIIIGDVLHGGNPIHSFISLWGVTSENCGFQWAKDPRIGQVLQINSIFNSSFRNFKIDTFGGPNTAPYFKQVGPIPGNFIGIALGGTGFGTQCTGLTFQNIVITGCGSGIQSGFNGGTASEILYIQCSINNCLIGHNQIDFNSLDHIFLDLAMSGNGIGVKTGASSNVIIYGGSTSDDSIDFFVDQNASNFVIHDYRSEDSGCGIASTQNGQVQISNSSFLNLVAHPSWNPLSRTSQLYTLNVGYATWRGNVDALQTQNQTITAANPAVVSWPGNNLTAGMIVTFTSGTLPSSGGLLLNTPYYVIPANLGSSSFEISATHGGSAISTIGGSPGSGIAIVATDPFSQINSFTANKTGRFIVSLGRVDVGAAPNTNQAFGLASSVHDQTVKVGSDTTSLGFYVGDLGSSVPASIVGNNGSTLLTLPYTVNNGDNIIMCVDFDTQYVWFRDRTKNTNFNNAVSSPTITSNTVTATSASPMVVSWGSSLTGSGIVAGSPFQFTSGTPPINTALNTWYFVCNDGNLNLAAGTFALSDTKAHAIAGTNKIASSSTGSALAGMAEVGGVDISWLTNGPWFVVGQVTTVFGGLTLGEVFDVTPPGFTSAWDHGKLIFGQFGGINASSCGTGTNAPNIGAAQIVLTGAPSGATFIIQDCGVQPDAITGWPVTFAQLTDATASADCFFMGNHGCQDCFEGNMFMYEGNGGFAIALEPTLGGGGRYLLPSQVGDTPNNNLGTHANVLSHVKQLSEGSLPGLIPDAITTNIYGTPTPGQNLRIQYTFSGAATANAGQTVPFVRTQACGTNGTIITATSGTFFQADVGKYVTVPTVGHSGGTWNGYIAKLVDTTHALALPASKQGGMAFAGSGLTATIGVNEPDGNYMVIVTGNANEIFWVTGITNTGFVVHSSVNTSTATVTCLIVR